MSDNFEIYIVHEKLERMEGITKHTKIATYRRNVIERIEAFDFESLEELDLYDNRITEIENLENMQSLKILDLSFNLIKQCNVPCLPTLKELYLIGNDIHSIEKMELLKLEKLDMAENAITAIENLENLPLLSELYLGSNRISEIPDLTEHKNLKIIDLQNNKLSKVDCKYLPVTLKTLMLNDNSQLEEILNLHLLENLDLIGVVRTKILLRDVKEQTQAEVWI